MKIQMCMCILPEENLEYYMHDYKEVESSTRGRNGGKKKKKENFNVLPTWTNFGRMC
jgi:hypothetical protein